MDQLLANLNLVSCLVETCFEGGSGIFKDLIVSVWELGIGRASLFSFRDRNQLRLALDILYL